MISFNSIVEQINSFLSALKRAYDQQGQAGKILIPGAFLLVFCCLCSTIISLLRPRNSPNPVPSPNALPSAGVQATPTALFNFGTVMFAPFPTSPSSTPFPTLTSLPTESQTPTQIVPTATQTSLPTVTMTIPLPTATTSGSVLIAEVNKALEYVDVQNGSNGPVDLSGWRLVSETGNQSCTLKGVLQPNEILRVWSGKGKSGFSCRFPINIWNDNQTDPAVLYDPQGREISRSP